MDGNAGWRYCPQCAGPLAWGDVDGLVRLACDAPGCGFVQWDNPLPVVAAIVECVDRGGEVLIARNRAWPEGKFGLVTGFLERGEDPVEAVMREVAEETSLVACEAPRLVGVYPFSRRNQVIIAYHVRVTGEIRLNDELAEYRLIVPERLRPWPEGTGPALRDWLLALGLPLPETL